MRSYLSSAIWISLIMFLPMAASSQPVEPEFNGLSAWELTLGEAVQTDCNIKLTVQKTGRIYCFSSEDARAAFKQDVEGNIERAKTEYQRLAK